MTEPKVTPIPMRNRIYWHAAAIVCLGALLFLAGSIKLESFPPLWWDEGWTLTVARNWVERGHYGRLLAGEPTPSGLEAAFPVTALVGLSFHLLGVGVWQGRMMGLVFMVGALGMMYYLALRLHDQRVAIGTLGVILLMSPHSAIHPLYMGRQVLAEIPSVFYLLGGYAFFWLALNRSAGFLSVAVVLWGVGILSKITVLPFWFISLSLPLGVTLIRRRWKLASLFGAGLLGSPCAAWMLGRGGQLLLPGHRTLTQPLQGAYEVTALVFEGFNRLFALQIILQFALPTLIALCFAAGKLFQKREQAELTSEVELMRLALLGLSGSWFIWFALLSIGWPRYLLPPMFISSLFVAVLLNDLTASFHLPSLKATLIEAVKNRSFNQKIGGFLLVTILIFMTLPPTLKLLYHQYSARGDTSAMETAKFLNSQTPAHALVETYESELHFLLQRKVHYPPDQVHVELNRRTFLGQDVIVGYDPLAADPDYLVIGSQGRMWQLYDPVVASGAFRLINRIGWYQVYERAR
ncbi:MAG TPA: hypothetical protein VEL68_11400 [Thermodesulfobacteriota bacterium]|nr:hypothetical protein [Thermodesulfobacteriota bacterium]